ncbi:hypothetical protein HKX48_008509 [Thoreauomyces humboldtii]|nr:hypothetical protein HKX48_008509 [Thoreauomyces humboldtii]
MPPHAPDEVTHQVQPASVPLPNKELLTGRDNMFITIEDEFHAMNVSGLYTFPETMTADELKTHIAAFAESFPRCRQRVVQPDGLFKRPYWEAHQQYTVDNHFTRIQLPASGSAQALMDLVGPMHSAELDKSKPLWHCYWFDGLVDENDKPKRVILFTAHHAIADGQGFVRRLLAYVASQDPTIKDASSLQYSAGHHAKAAVTAANTGAPADASMVAARTTQALAARIHGLVVLAMAVLAYLYNMLLIALTPRNSYTTRTNTTQKQASWTTSHIDLQTIKDIKNQYKVTVNDVLTACVGAALGGHLPADVQDPRFWLLIPTSMRRPDDTSASNKSSGYILPVLNGAGVNVAERIHAVHGAMKYSKASPEAIVNYSVLDIVFRFPNLWKLPFAGVFLMGSQKLHGVLTNVPGPMQTIRWGSHAIEGMCAFIPQAGPNSVSCAVYTYNGAVTLSVFMDHIPGDESFGDNAARNIVKSFETAVRAASLYAQANAIEFGTTTAIAKKIQ